MIQVRKPDKLKYFNHIAVLPDSNQYTHIYFMYLKLLLYYGSQTGLGRYTVEAVRVNHCVFGQCSPSEGRGRLSCFF